MMEGAWIQMSLPRCPNSSLAKGLLQLSVNERHDALPYPFYAFECVYYRYGLCVFWLIEWTALYCTALDMRIMEA